MTNNEKANLVYFIGMTIGVFLLYAQWKRLIKEDDKLEGRVDNDALRNALQKANKRYGKMLKNLADEDEPLHIMGSVAEDEEGE